MNFHQSDKVIVTEILNGNIQDFAVVVKNTEKLVTQIVRKMVSNENDQKDLVQDIYLNAYQNLPTFQFKSKLSTRIANIAYHKTINYLQKKKIPIIELTAETKNSFFIEEIAARVLFNLNTDGTIRSLTFSQGGKKIEGNKIK